MSIYFRWAQTEHRPAARIAATVAAGLTVILLLPFFVVKAGRAIDRKLGMPEADAGPLRRAVGALLLAVGSLFGLWSVVTQLTRGRGSPVPALPTQELLAEGPFAAARNPMTFGTILIYLGLVVVAGTLGGAAVVAVLCTLLLLYIKLVEEKELAERFGNAYLRYRSRTPFLIPRFPRRK